MSADYPGRIQPHFRATDGETGDEHLPLRGVRVLDLTTIFSGPLANRQLADLGAEVIKVERPEGRGPRGVPPGLGVRGIMYPHRDPTPDQWNRQGSFNKLNRNKLGLCIDTGKPGGLDLFKELLLCTDVVCENFTSRVFPNWGLDWEHLHRLNPQLIYVSMPGYGRTGPYRDFSGVGTVLEPHAGLSSLMAYDETLPYMTTATYTDPLMGTVAPWAIIAALLRREQTGEGTAIDFAQVEAATRLMGAELLAFQGGCWSPTYASRDPVFAPQGVYPSAGDDEWVAITVQNEPAWAALCRVMGRADWAGCEAFATAEGRRRRHDELDAGITAWTVERSKCEAMQLLQAAGVSAGAALTNQEMVESDVLAPDFMVQIEENWGELMPYPRFPVRIEGTERRHWYRAPRLGEHNVDILADLLGHSEAEIERLQALGTIAEMPPS